MGSPSRVTRKVTSRVVWNKSGDYPFGDKHHAVGISARTTIQRSDFGMTYAVAGGIVGDDVDSASWSSRRSVRIGRIYPAWNHHNTAVTVTMEFGRDQTIVDALAIAMP